MTVFRGISAVGTSVLIDIRVALHVRVQHGLVDACIVAFVALEWFRSKMVPQMILQVVLVLSHKRAFWTLEDLLFLNVGP